jgi:hypothetical protein
VPALPSIDGRVFDLVSSTASEVDAAYPTQFTYRERDGAIWGEYAGDTVRHGHFVGERRGDVLLVHFVHALVAGGAPVSGAAESRIEQQGDGRLRLVEDFEADGAPQQSVCVEVPAT